MFRTNKGGPPLWDRRGFQQFSAAHAECRMAGSAVVINWSCIVVVGVVVVVVVVFVGDVPRCGDAAVACMYFVVVLCCCCGLLPLMFVLLFVVLLLLLIC